jgi:dTMP kinase
MVHGVYDGFVHNRLETLTQLFRSPETPGSLFLSFEGIEGSGKSTQITEIENFLKNKGFQVLVLREPGGTVFGEKLREAILQSDKPIHPLAECHLFLASRTQLLNEKILPFLLNPGSVVVLDRYIDSTLAYQGKARKLGFETVLTLHQHGPLNLLPHRTYLLDIDANVSHQRQIERGNIRDYFESQKIEFYENLIDGYRDVANLFRDRIVKINAGKSKEEVTSLVINDLKRFLA